MNTDFITCQANYVARNDFLTFLGFGFPVNGHQACGNHHFGLATAGCHAIELQKFVEFHRFAANFDFAHGFNPGSS